MQIVHDIRKLMQPAGDPRKGLAALKAQGIGGIVTNIPFDNYMEGAEAWRTLREFLRACKAMDMRVWIYDEKGYPSGYAGGLVLAGRPDLEAVGLYRNPETGEIAPGKSYEGTHSCNNYCVKARTPNLLDPNAVAEFVRVTHDRYAKELGADLEIVEAFFTDEPALNVLYMPRIPEASDCPVIDPPDETRPLYPGVPWSADLAARFGKRDLSGLFVDLPGAGQLRREFYEAVGEQLADTYFGGLRRWCAAHGRQSSGHLLWEEVVSGHTPLYGNFLRCMMEFTIPGIDVLSAEPLTSYRSNRLAAAFATSAAMLGGQRRVFTESSDHSQRIQQHRLASVDEVRATLAWQAALGVTEFTMYFAHGACPEIESNQAWGADCGSRTPGEYAQINDDISALVARLAPARLLPDVFLYYPVELLQAAYYPTLRPYAPGGCAPEVSRIAQAFTAAVHGLLDVGIVPCVIDGGLLRELRAADGDAARDGRYAVRQARANAVVYPAGCEPPADCIPGVDCQFAEMSEDLPLWLFENGVTRLFNDNANICAALMGTEDGSQVTMVNLTDRTQAVHVRTQSGSVDVTLDAYRWGVTPV